MDSKKDKFNKTVVAHKYKQQTMENVDFNASGTDTWGINMWTAGGTGDNINSGSGGGDYAGAWVSEPDGVIRKVYVGDNPPSNWGGKVGDTIPDLSDYDVKFTGVPPGGINTNNPLFNGWSITGTDTNEILKNDSIPNKLDKDLVNTKLPYNLKKNFNEDLFYDFAVAGYSVDRIKLLKINNGIRLMLKELDESDDLVGEEYEFICKGIKNLKLTEDIFIDGELYDLENFTANLENGILSIFVPKKNEKTLHIKKVTDKNKGITKLI
jgi:HSP20 family molecular chaperone IbpA